MAEGFRLSEYLPTPGGVAHVGIVLLHQRYLLPCPLFRAGVALDLAVERERQLYKAAVVPACAYAVGKGEKAGVAVGITVAAFHYPLQSGVLHANGPLLVHYFKVRAKADKVAVFP